jgi:hypothetical protein
MLEVRLPDDPRQPVRRTALVRDLEPLDAEHALSATREVEEGSAAHAADADHDHVVALHSGVTLAQAG